MQAILYIAAGVFMIYQVVMGWRRGFARCFVRVAALILAFYIGLYFGMLAAPFLRGLFPYPDFVLMCAVGGIAGLLVYFAIWLVSAILLKKTSHQKSGAIRLLYGGGGAVMGGVYGLLILWGFISLFRAFGAYAESRADVTREGHLPASGLERQLVNLKSAMEGGSTGKMVEKVDIVPNSIYQLIVKSGQVTADPEALERFASYPPVQKLLETPRMAAILNDPEVARASSDKNYFILMRNKNIVAAINDPDFRKMISEFDFVGALDHALKKPPSQKSPTPHKK